MLQGRRLWVAAALLVAFGCDEPSVQEANRDPEVVDKRLAGGAGTVFVATSNAFSTPMPNLDAAGAGLHAAGDAAFEAVFVTSPAIVNPGLGPAFNRAACIHCHPRDGRGRAPDEGAAPQSMLARVSIGNDPVDGPVPAPGFGTQVQDRAVFGTAPEGRVSLSYEYSQEVLSDGLVVSLRRPSVHVDAEDLPEDAMLSARVAPVVFGTGLLEAISDDTILAREDPHDRDGDGISGRANQVWDPLAQGLAVGRFGLKATVPTVLQQVAGAYVEDMGVTNSVFTTESTKGQVQDDARPDDPELADEELETTTFYVQTLGVPARRDVDDEQVSMGEEHFRNIGCASCHTPAVMTGDISEVPILRGQVIQPFTDLLLHDMGEGLADNRPAFTASGREWRTTPLWGIGLTKVVNGHTEFLHDGRARSLTEAILWHGGEAAVSRERFRRLEPDERAALLVFLQSL